MENATLHLRTPATPEHAVTLRLFLAEAGRHFHVADEPISDLKIAVTEAFGLAAKTTLDKSAMFSIELKTSGENMTALISTTGGFNYNQKDGKAVSGIMGSAIIEALFPDVRPNSAGTLRLSVPIGSRV